MATRVSLTNGRFDVTVPNVALGIDPDNLNSRVNDIDTAGIYLKNGFAVKAVSGDISFDPQQIEIIDLWEGSVLNEGGTFKTLFLKNIDNQSGILTFGLTRTGEEDAGINPVIGRILNIAYKPVSADTAIFRFESTAVTSAVDNILIPHTAVNDTLPVRSTATRVTYLFIAP